MALTMFASFRGYVFASLLLTTAVISHAVYMKRFFYRSVIFLAKSKFAILAVGNMALVSVLLLWRLIQAIFLGPLRFREVERLHIRARDAVIECCFAISVFREEFNLKFVALVMTLLLLKSLHWLTKDRIEFLEEQPLSPVRTHVRLVGLMTMLLLLDLFLIRHFAAFTYHSRGPTMFVLFAFEFTVLIIDLVSDIARYAFLVIDTSMEGHWEEKGMFSFYIELLCDLCQLTVYVLFFIYVLMKYTFPYHIIRELYMTFSKFQRRCSDFLRYRRVVATMNDLFADATEEELAEGDRTCIICREEMQTAKKLSCGHIFHSRCLQSWLKRQLSCPTCRAAIDVNGNESSNAPNARNVNQNNQQQQQQQPNQANNNINPNNNNDINNNNNGNRNIGAAGQNNQGPVNIGEAGARLINFANQWWTQVMNEAGAGVGAGGAAGGAAGGGAAGAGAAGGGAAGGGAAGAGAAGAGAAGAGGVGAGAGADANAANQRRFQPLPPDARQPLGLNNGIAGNVYLRGPNAVAHMQLRARRRGAWPQPFQPYQMPPNMHQHPHHAPQHLHQPHQHPLNPVYNVNPIQRPQPQNRQQAASSSQSDQTNVNSLQAQSSSPPSAAATGDGYNGNVPNPTEQQRTGQGSEAGPASSGNAGSSASASGSTSTPQGNLAGSSQLHEASYPLPPGGASTVPPEADSSISATQHSTHVSPTYFLRQATIPGVVGPSVGPGEVPVQALPLERLLAIQEQIEVLRNEVMELVLAATSQPPASASATEDGVATAAGQPGQGGASASAAQEEVAAAENEAPEAGNMGAGNRNGDEDSEASMLRRRRIEFLERNAGS